MKELYIVTDTQRIVSTAVLALFWYKMTLFFDMIVQKKKHGPRFPMKNKTSSTY